MHFSSVPCMPHAPPISFLQFIALILFGWRVQIVKHFISTPSKIPWSHILLLQ